MGDSRHKAPYTRGPRREMTPEWKAIVISRLEELRQTRAWLADQIGAKSAASITQMLGDEQHASVWVDSVCRVLGIAPPALGVDGLEREAIAILKGLNAADREQALAILRRLRG